MTSFHHISVLRDETLGLLLEGDGNLFVDATLGAGGHAEAILRARPSARVIGIDQDPRALDFAAKRLQVFGDRVQLIHGNFRDLGTILARYAGTIDGVVFDLGVSSAQLDQPDRGFTYQEDAPLDMRMDPGNDRTAFRLVNMGEEAELVRVLREYGEERWATRIVKFIVEARKREPIRTSGQLVAIVKAAIPASARRSGGHPARRTFQALRIWVNQELDALMAGLDASREILAPQGRIAVISFHSLEDRIVKHCFREWAAQGYGQVLTKKPIQASDMERVDNPRSRAAKLRGFLVKAEESS